MLATFVLSFIWGVCVGISFCVGYQFRNYLLCKQINWYDLYAHLQSRYCSDRRCYVHLSYNVFHSWEFSRVSSIVKSAASESPVFIELWCNGNTSDFGSEILGSSPDSSII